MQARLDTSQRVVECLHKQWLELFNIISDVRAAAGSDAYYPVQDEDVPKLVNDLRLDRNMWKRGSRANDAAATLYLRFLIEIKKHLGDRMLQIDSCADVPKRVKDLIDDCAALRARAEEAEALIDSAISNHSLASLDPAERKRCRDNLPVYVKALRTAAGLKNDRRKATPEDAAAAAEYRQLEAEAAEKLAALPRFVTLDVT